MKPKKRTAIAVPIIACIFAVLSLTGCDDGSTGGGDNGAKTLSGTVTISPSGNVTTGTVLTAAYSGNETVTYRWNKDGSAIPGAAGAAYTPPEAGSYTVTVSAAGYKSKTSAAVTVTATLPDLPGAVTISPSGNVTIGTPLTAAYSGNETVTYLWNRNEAAISGATNAAYTPSEAGSYTVTASVAGYKSKTSAAVTVTATLPDLPGTVTISPSGNVNTGTPLTAVYSGNETVTYLWNKDGSAIPGATGAAYTPSEAGSYTVTASAAGYKSKTSAAVTVWPRVVDIAIIQGVTAPVAGRVPVTSITENEQYSGTITWNGNPSIFAASTIYTATITLTVKTGYTLQGVEANFFTVAGATTVGNSVNSGVVTAVFPADVTFFVEMINVPGGNFEMGKELGTAASSNITPVHTVTLSGFYMSKYPVTQAQYQAVMGSNPSYFNSNPASGEVQGKRPVESVSWYDAIVFCNRLSMAEGLSPAYRISGSTNPSDWGTVPSTSSNSRWNSAVIVAGSNGYRLPTEAQWEYAAKGGNGTPGNYTYSGSNTTGDVAWYSSNSNNMTHEVGKKQPNGLGIYDMSGNVWEWCWDWYGSYSSSTQTDPQGAASGDYRVGRGGSWYNVASSARSVFRDGSYPGIGFNDIGFRLVRP